MFETSALDNSHCIDRKGQGPDRQRKLFQITSQQEPDQLLDCTWLTASTPSISTHWVGSTGWPLTSSDCAEPNAGQDDAEVLKLTGGDHNRTSKSERGNWGQIQMGEKRNGVCVCVCLFYYTRYSRSTKFERLVECLDEKEILELRDDARPWDGNLEVIQQVS